MISSMTGFGRSEVENDYLVLSVEIKSVNSRFLDFAPRLSKILSPFEDDAQKLVKDKCARGRVSLSAKIDYLPGKRNGMSLNHDKLDEYMNVVKEIQESFQRKDVPSMGDILRLPEIYGGDENSIDDDLKNLFLKAVNEALTELDEVRQSEGKNISVDLNSRLEQMGEVSQTMKSLAESNRDHIKSKYQQKIQDLLEDVSIDETRLYQEVAIISEKRDITEELVRLNSHLDLFKSYMHSDKYEGKKLNFLLQEMGREINTIGSKTDLIEISHMVVDLKDELEKIREQVQNII